MYDDDEEVSAMLDACKLSSIERENVLMNCEEYAKESKIWVTVRDNVRKFLDFK